MQKFLIYLIRFYQIGVSPVFPPSCRYTPTCSQYAIDAINLYGIFIGTWMAFRRVMRCHPLHRGGFDPVEK